MEKSIHSASTRHCLEDGKQRDTVVPLKELKCPQTGGVSREAVFKGEEGDTYTHTNFLK